ncbi:hypothetical protein OG948_46465 (plasmid) [Embleya sp. NBC_00888]|uniref:hypothetical protein n=1 Tax=Embleya sp. NBC_00888 TaxID=2975960 RepID=UPI002F9192E6|nr:hypothetical protein OG948_46465 [Embleya sp. NBC_00888]
MPHHQRTHAALTSDVRPMLDSETGELRLRITLYAVDEPIEHLDLVLSGPEVADLVDVVRPSVTT